MADARSRSVVASHAAFGNSFLVMSSVSQKLGQYMLSGWVLTDVPCSSPGCRVPLMRSPQGRLPIIHFCANCDNDPDSSSSSNHSTGASTPPTEVSNPPESPQFIPVPDTEHIRRRREQSDTASREIGNRLLQGWAMLADECPGPTCYGVPLVRPPKVGSKDPRKECVICGTSYISEVDPSGRHRLTPFNAVNQSSDSARAETTAASSIQIVPTVPDVIATRHDAAARFAASSLAQLMGSSYGGMEILQELEESSKSLRSVLRTLSTQLESLSRQDVLVNPSSIGSTADAILKVTQALSQVRQLEQSERRGRSLVPKSRACLAFRGVGLSGSL